MTDKFNNVINMVECLDIISKRKMTGGIILEYDVANPPVNRKFLEFQVKVILKFFEKYMKDNDVDKNDEEAVFMYMYSHTNIMKMFRDMYGNLPDEVIEKWNDRDINTILKQLKSKTTIK